MLSYKNHFIVIIDWKIIFLINDFFHLFINCICVIFLINEKFMRPQEEEDTMWERNVNRKLLIQPINGKLLFREIN